MPIPAALAAATRAVVSTNDADRVAYARDLWPRHLIDLREGHAAGTRPQAIAWAESTEQAAAIVSWCAEEGVPIVPFGAGSGVCGGVLPDARTVVLDLKRMKRWRALDKEGFTLDVEAGALGITLEEELAREGLTIGHFPSSILCSTVGGWIAARGAGQMSGRYGKIEDMVLDLEVIDGRGEIAHLQRRTSDLDLVPLLVGSEGTLGVITSARMRLHPSPKTRGFASFGFRTTEGGWEAMRAFFQAGLRPAVARLYDPFDAALARQGSAEKHAPHEIGAGGKMLRSLLSSPRVLNGLIDALEGRVPGRGFDAMLVLVFEGSAEETAEGASTARAMAARLGGTDLGEAPAKKWLEHRYAVSYRQPPSVRMGLFVDTMEVAAPWSKLHGLYDDVRRALGRDVFVMAHLSHAYPDGCSIYFTFAGSAGSADDAHDKYDRTWRRTLDAAIAAGGTLSHHHGVGRSKAPRLGDELGLGIDVFRALKHVFDPASVLNPGNLASLEGPRHPGEDPASLPGEITIDELSLLAHVPAEVTLERVEHEARARGATLGLDPALRAQTVASWIGAGCPGAVSFLDDPVDHALAGLDARIPDGRILRVRPAPRRAVGPDLMTLFMGTAGRYGTPLAAWVRLHRQGARKVRSTKVVVDRDPAMLPREQAFAEAIRRALR